MDPSLLNSHNRDVLLNLYNDLIYRDIIVRQGLRNPKTIRELGVFFASNTGKEFSYNKLANTFDLGSSNTLTSYISYFEDAYLFFTVPRFSYSMKQQAKNPKKIYGIDAGLITMLSMSFSKIAFSKLAFQQLSADQAIRTRQPKGSSLCPYWMAVISS